MGKPASLRRVAAGIAHWRPRTALGAFNRLGRSLWQVGLSGPSTQELDKLFGPWPPERSASAAKAIAGVRAMRWLADSLLARYGFDGVRPLIDCPDADRLREMMAAREPTILIAMHFGWISGIAPALHTLQVPTLIMASRPPLARNYDPLRYRFELSSRQTRAAALKEALDQVRGGGIVLLALDGIGKPTIDVPFLGRVIPITRGPAALARLTGVSLTPITSAFGASGRFEVRLHRKLPLPTCPRSDAEAFETALTREAIAWFEKQTRQMPEQTSPYKIAWLQTAPLA